MTKNAYIHIPFCKSKCKYCSFVSYEDLQLKDKYLEALIKQIKDEYKGEELNTLYFGGGTPSVLTISDFTDLMNLFKLDKNAEVTVEVNPDSVDFLYLKSLRQLGVNRLSIGAQTFDDEILKILGRRHNSEQIKTALGVAKSAGFENISLDFMYGLPGQTLAGFENDLKNALKSDVQHISLYGLKLEQECYFYLNTPKNLPDLDLQADMYFKSIEILHSGCFKHYEISNFARFGFCSKHNLNYWDNFNYYGFGCSASGYIDNTRYMNESDLIKYIENPLCKIFKQELTQQEILEEAIFLGLRKIAGVNINEINQKFGIDFYTKYSNILNKYSNYFLQKQDNLALTPNGILISNSILSEFIE